MRGQELPKVTSEYLSTLQKQYSIFDSLIQGVSGLLATIDRIKSEKKLESELSIRRSINDILNILVQLQNLYKEQINVLRTKDNDLLRSKFKQELSLYVSLGDVLETVNESTIEQIVAELKGKSPEEMERYKGSAQKALELATVGSVLRQSSGQAGFINWKLLNTIFFSMATLAGIGIIVRDPKLIIGWAGMISGASSLLLTLLEKKEKPEAE